MYIAYKYTNLFMRTGGRGGGTLTAEGGERFVPPFLPHKPLG